MGRKEERVGWAVQLGKSFAQGRKSLHLHGNVAGTSTVKYAATTLFIAVYLSPFRNAMQRSSPAARGSHASCPVTATSCPTSPVANRSRLE
jgi:hypothetical protein